MIFVYALLSESTNKIYIGQTSDLKKRLERHNNLITNKTSSYTFKNKGPWKVIYKEVYENRTEALKREKQLKSYRGRVFIRTLIK